MFIRNANISGAILSDKIPVTFDPDHTAAQLSLSDDRLTITDTGGGGNVMSYATESRSSGKWYCEFYYTYSPNENVTWGVVESGHSVEAESWPGDTALSYGLYANDGYIYNDGNDFAYGSQFTTDDLVMMALDMDNGKIYWGLNGTWFDSGDPAAQTNPAFTGLSGAKFIAVASLNTDTIVTMNFGATTFVYTPPSGFLPW